MEIKKVKNILITILKFSLIALVVAFLLPKIIFFDNIQYKRIGNTNFYLLQEQLGVESHLKLKEDGSSLFFDMGHKGVVNDVYWNEDYIIIKCRNRSENDSQIIDSQIRFWYIIKNLEYYNWKEFDMKMYSDQTDYNKALDSIGINENVMKHTDGNIPWGINLF